MSRRRKHATPRDAARVDSELRYARYFKTNRKFNMVTEDYAPPPEVSQAAAVRNGANQSLTARLFGDPKPGQSALDQMRARVVERPSIRIGISDGKVDL